MKKSSIFILVLAVFIVTSLNSALAASDVPAEVLDARKYIARIIVTDDDGEYTGSGFVIDGGETNYIVTNHHVIEDAQSIRVYVGETNAYADIVVADSGKDLCILKTETRLVDGSIPFSQTEAEQGAAVYALGFPAAADYLQDDDFAAGEDALTITDGIISSIRQVSLDALGRSPVRILQISAPLNGGNSGGPVLNKSGTVVGIVTLQVLDSQGIGGAISVSELSGLIAGLPTQTDGDISPDPSSREAAYWPFYALAAAVSAVFALMLYKTLTKKITLEEFMRQRRDPLSRSEALGLLRGAAKRLEALHSEGTPYLALSPANVYINTRPSKALAVKKYTTGIDSEYAAPELISGQSFDARSDIYSFCALYSYLISGEPPQRGEDVYRAAPDIDDDLAEILKKGLALEPESRHSSMSELLTMLSLTQGIAPVRIKKPIRRVIAYACAWAFCLLAVAFGYIYTDNRHIAEQCVEALKHDRFDDAESAYQKIYVHFADLSGEREYIDAWLLLEQNRFEEASDAFATMPGLYSADEWVKMSLYAKADHLASQGEYDSAIDLVKSIAGIPVETNEKMRRFKEEHPEEHARIRDIRFKEAAELLSSGDYGNAYRAIGPYAPDYDYPQARKLSNEIYYQWGNSLYDSGDYIGAVERYSIMIKLFENEYNDVYQKIDEAKDRIYAKAIENYRDGYYETAETMFNKLEDYDLLFLTSEEKSDYYRMSDEKRPHPYILRYQVLIWAHEGGLWGTMHTDAEKIEEVNNFANDFEFEDVPEILLEYTDMAKRFLLGEWIDLYGNYLRMYRENGVYYAAYNMGIGIRVPTWVDETHFDFKNGDFKVDNMNLFYMELITPDSMYLTAYRTGETYLLWRQ